VVSKGAAIPNLVFLPYSTAQGGYCGAPFAPPQASPVGIGSSYYTVVKCLGWDNALAAAFDRWLKVSKPDIEQVNQAVWNEIFRTYYYAFPYMDFISDPAAFQSYADKSLARTDPGIFSRSTYMPVTRTWSAGQRHVMLSYVNYLKSYSPEAAAKDGVAAFSRPEPEGMAEQRSEASAGREVLGHG
jgi:hypothetical protein